MAATLWRALTPGRLFAWSGISLIFLPLLPGLWLTFAPALQAASWQLFWQDNQWWPALQVTLISSIIACAGALLLALLVIIGLWPGLLWQRLQQKLPLLLAFPHVAFASGFLLLCGPGGWLARLLASCGFAQADWSDSYGVGIGLVLALKECGFLLWVASAQLPHHALQRQLTVYRSLGYGRWQSAVHIVLPQLLPRLGWALFALLAYSVSVVDVAIIIGPGNPPTLAVLAWRWLNDIDTQIQTKGVIATFILILLLLVLALTGYLAWRRVRPLLLSISGKRRAWQGRVLARGITQAITTSSVLVLAGLFIWSVAGSWFFPDLLPQRWSWESWQHLDWQPLCSALELGVITSVVGLMVSVSWLEWGAGRYQAWLWLPLMIPALPLAAGQYRLLLLLGLDGTFLAVAWSHLLWVVPYMLLLLSPAYQRTDKRLLMSARTLGWSPVKVLWYVKWPVLIRGFFAALAIGFSVSIAQYLPTLYAGAGRITTVTTEAVALSSGGDVQQQAQQALLQALLPALFFGLSAWCSRMAGRYRQGLR